MLLRNRRHIWGLGTSNPNCRVWLAAGRPDLHTANLSLAAKRRIRLAAGRPDLLTANLPLAAKGRVRLTAGRPDLLTADEPGALCWRCRLVSTSSGQPKDRHR